MFYSLFSVLSVALLILCLLDKVKSNVKASPVQVWRDPEGYSSLRLLRGAFKL